MSCPAYVITPCSRSMYASSEHAIVSMNFAQSVGVWKPTISLPSRPVSRSLVHGQIWNSRASGHGMCQKATMVLSGSRSRRIPGTSAK